MTEPFIVRQTADLVTPEDKLAWLQGCAQEAKTAGAVLCRASEHPYINDLVLFEAWLEWPEDQGDQRWALSA